VFDIILNELGGMPQPKCIFAPSSVNFSGSGNPMQVALTMKLGR
jgi:hypothetical protein